VLPDNDVVQLQGEDRARDLGEPGYNPGKRVSDGAPAALRRGKLPSLDPANGNLTAHEQRVASDLERLTEREGSL
jgi:hypothetical protein